MLRKRLCDEFLWMDLRTGPTGFPRRTHYGSRTSADASSLHEDTRSRFTPPGASTLVITSEGIGNNFGSYMLKGPRAVRSSICFFV